MEIISAEEKAATIAVAIAFACMVAITLVVWFFSNNNSGQNKK